MIPKLGFRQDHENLVMVMKEIADIGHFARDRTRLQSLYVPDGTIA